MAAPLRRVRQIGYAVLGCQLVFFLAWSTILYQRFSLTYDFAIYHQAWFLIAHGNLDPIDTVQHMPFWRNHCEFGLWPLALLYWMWPHGVLLLWVQDIGVVGAEAVMFTWLCEITDRQLASNRGRDVTCLAVAGLVLLVANPWTWEAVTWDFHAETLAILFAALVARDLANGRRRVWVWVVPLLGCGDVAATYLAGLGLGGTLAGRRYRLPGLGMLGLGLGTLLLITLLHGDLGSGRGLQAYAYLAGARPNNSPLSPAALTKGIVSHPSAVLSALWAKRLDVWANLAPSGLLGACFIALLPITLVVMLANNLFNGLLFAAPGFQSLPFYVLLPAGTIAVLGWLSRRHRWAPLLLTGLIVIQALAWTAIWAPRIPGQWLRVPPSTAATLTDLEARIPASAEVIASQGIVGRFSGRTDVQALFSPGTLPVEGETWFVIAPTAGIESLGAASSIALIGELAGPLHANLITTANGVWAFRWQPPSGVHKIVVPDGSAPVPAWAAVGAAGRAVMTGPATEWHATSTIGKGYVADGLAWQEPPGRYQAEVALSATGPVNVEVWNDTGNILLARRTIMPTAGVESVALGVDATAEFRAGAFSGWGPFSGAFLPPQAGNRLEVRVWSPGGSVVNVYSADMVPASRGGELASAHHDAADNQPVLPGRGLGHREVVPTRPP